MERKALKLALEVMQINLTLLKKVNPYKGQEDLVSDSLDLTHKAIATVKEALAQPVQEPYGYDWSMLEAAQESLREHMARIHELEAALAQPAQEPVGEIRASSYGNYPVVVWVNGYVEKIGDKFYTTPPQREWVGLTEEETSGFTSHEMTVVKYVSKVLQEKNHG